MKKSKGASTFDLVIYLTVISLLVVFVMKAVYTPLSLFVEKSNYERAFDLIEQAVIEKVKVDFNKNGFKNLPSVINQNILEHDKYINKNIFPNPKWKYVVVLSGFKHNTSATWTNYNRMNITISPISKSELEHLKLINFDKKYNVSEINNGITLSLPLSLKVFDWSRFSPVDGSFKNFG